jgi:hypothetical protein
VDVEQIMRQIRTRIREKRGADYTDAEIQQLASVKLEQFADPSGLKSDLLEQFRKRGDEPSTYHRHRGPRRWLLMLLHPILKRVQKQVMSDLNLYFEIIHNLVVETTRLGIEVQNLKMRVESLSSRVDFDERRARALEGAVQYRRTTGTAGAAGATGTTMAATPAPPAAAVAGPAGAPGPAGPAGPANPVAGDRPDGVRGDGERRRRRRRRRRRPGGTLADSPNAGQNGGPAASNGSADPDGPDGPDGPETQDGSDK